MSKFKPGLGRGLDALIKTNVNDISGEIETIKSAEQISADDGNSFDILVKIPIFNILPNPYQPRVNFLPEALDELKKSILENGLIQPITVRRAGDKQYELISGERRLRACKEIGFTEIPAYIIVVDSKESMIALALIENIQREKLNPIEIAHAYKKLLEECNLSQEEIAKRVGKDRTTITNFLRLLKLPNLIQESVAKEEISGGHARALLSLPSEALQIEFLGKTINQNLSVRKLESMVKKFSDGSTQTSIIIEKSDKGKDLSTLSTRDLENRLRNILGTKVECRQLKDGTGNITIEFYSEDELERLLDLFEIISQNNY
ncbi:MAG TPA: ParB/RepB/Spo0J family partition protein [Melioribacteraceae bacterium]|nr:ParB/RepB/Spo0J family partition protein [Melioribacteraceae bacterium]